MKQTDLVGLIKKTGIDGIVFDIQDVGARYYTFIWTMFDMMCAAAATKNNFNFFVLDRPNPLGGETVRGPMLQSEYISGVGKVAGIPAVHGMTVGELAKYFNEKAMATCDVASSNIVQVVNLTVVQMEGWDTSKPFPTNQLPWVLPNPNMHTANRYGIPGNMLALKVPVSVKGGHNETLSNCGAAYLDYTFSLELMDAVHSMCGVIVRETFFIPTFSKFAGNISAGVDITVTDPSCFDPVRLAVEILTLAKKHAPEYFSWINGNDVDILSRSNFTRIAIDEARSVDSIISHYSLELQKSGFMEERKSFFLYPR